MPILAVDKYGRLYQTGRDRSDGLGYSSHPEYTTQGDVTYGSAYLKSQDRQRQENLGRYREQQQIDRNEAITRETQRRQINQKRIAENSETAQLQDTNVRKMLLKKALQMGCPCEYSTPGTGNVMTANGLSGKAGMSRDQRAIHDHYHGNSPTAHKISANEARQMIESSNAKRSIQLGAAKSERRREMEKIQDKIRESNNRLRMPRNTAY